MTQLSLFDNPQKQSYDETRPQLSSKPARKSDPVTSQSAAESIDLNKLQKLFMQSVKRFTEPATAREVAEMAKTISGTKCEVESIRKRAHELEERRLIRVCGMRHCKYTGKMAETWEAVK